MTHHTIEAPHVTKQLQLRLPLHVTTQVFIENKMCKMTFNTNAKTRSERNVS